MVTGAKRGTKHRLLYEDLQQEELEIRRTKHKIVMMYKIVNGQAPVSLSKLIPERAEERHQYNVSPREIDPTKVQNGITTEVFLSCNNKVMEQSITRDQGCINHRGTEKEVKTQ